MRHAAPVAVALCAALVAAAVGAAADSTDPKVRTTKAGSAQAKAALLRFSDLGPAWTGGALKPTSLKFPVCPSNQPNDSDLTITGHAESQLTLTSSGLQIDADVAVFRSPAQVERLVQRTLGSGLLECLQYDLLKSVGSNGVTVGTARALPVAAAGDHVGLYRVPLGVRSGKQTVRVDGDFLFVSKGNTQFSVSIVAPSSLESELPALENRIAKLLASRV